MAIPKSSADIPHPGIRLRQECLEPRGMTVTSAAEEIGISRQALNNILNGKAGIRPEMAIRLARFFGLLPETLQQWQKDYELVNARSSRANLHRARGSSGFVRSSHLVAWADFIDARYALPKLIRTLIRATAGSGSTVDFPAFEDAQLPGYDGMVDNPSPSDFVPYGKSVWELSTDKNPSAKADRDYESRTQDPLQVDPKETTIVMVSLRRWPKKREWEASKNKMGDWAKVVAYDATNLEQWLELVPGANMWLVGQLGLSFPGARSMEVFWSEYSLSSSPPISAALLLAGRDDDAGKVGQWLQSGSGVLSILADSSDEALAFVAAVGEDRGIESTLTNMIVVSDSEQARQLMASTYQITFGWQLDDMSLLGTIVDKGHRAIVPMSRNGAGANHADIELNRRPSRNKFVAAVERSLWNSAEPPEIDDNLGPESDLLRKKKGQIKEDAEQRALASGRSVTVYRRLFPAGGVRTKPAWASDEFAPHLVPILLAGSWNEGNEADHSALADLADSDYSTINRVLARWKNQPDSPFRRVGDSWELAAPLDAWSSLWKSVNENDLKRHKNIILKVLGESDPALTFESHQRYLASLVEKTFKYSKALRRGLAQSLIMLSIVAGETKHVEDVVWQLLGRDAPSTAWASLYELLPVLAEAEPKTFLCVVENSLRSPDQSILSLFEIEERPLGGESRYPYLLWALEMLAWFPEYLGKSAKMLAKLAKCAPRKERSLLNPPEKSLREVFCSWHPNTTASLDERLDVIDFLMRYADPDVVWSILLELLPKIHDVGATNAEPKWRALPEKEVRTYGEIWRANEQIVARTLAQAGLEIGRLSQLIEKCRTWSPEQRAALLARLGEFSATCNDPKILIELWNNIRDFIGESRAYQFLGETDIQPWDELLRRIEPLDPLEKYVWLFDSEVLHITEPKTLFTEEHSGLDVTQARMKESREAQIEAAALILQDQGIEGLLKLAARANAPYLVGQAAAEKSRPDESKILEQALAADDPKIQRAGMAFGFNKVEKHGLAWAEAILQSKAFKAWTPKMQASFCRTLPENRATWDIVESLGKKVHDIFWKETSIFVGRIKADEDAEYAMAKLLAAGRSLDALDQAGFYSERLPSALLVQILDSAVKPLSASNPGTFSHDVERILSRLRAGGDVPDGELGRLEWIYLPLLRFSHSPITLYKALKNDPAFFAEVVQYAFRVDTEASTQTLTKTPKKIDEVAANRAKHAFDLLSRWNDMPGRGHDGNLNEQQLSQWFQEARRLNESNGRKQIGDVQIGRMLAWSGPGQDGIWPHEAVRDLIEQADSRDLESGFHMGKFNSRGVYSKSPADGGRPEREIAKKFKADARKLGNRWPNTASILNSLADVYEKFGKYDDATVEAMDLLP